MATRHILLGTFVAVFAELMLPGLAQAQPSQTELDAWSAELIRYCTPEIRRYTRLSLEETRREIAEANRNRQRGDAVWNFNERSERDQIKRLIENRVHYAVAHIYRSDIKLIHGQLENQPKQKSPAVIAIDRAENDVVYCVRSRLLELEFPDYKRW